MNAVTRRLAAVAALTAAPALIALGAATASQAQTSVTNTGPSVSHHAFPHQDNVPQPGSRIHHHHQGHHWK
jgi:hypothetical protein